VAIRRTDKAEPDPPGPYPPTWTYATNPAFLTPADRVRYDFALASPCPQPTPGATASVSLPLAPEAWYEIYIQASPEDDLWYAPGRLPGVTFRTSRWRTPQQMFAGLGWTIMPGAGGQSVTIGDLAVEATPAVATLPAATSDQAFISALAALGANDWPVANAPRLSRLWSAKDDHWRFAGLLVESPEPIIRPGRVSVDGLALEGMDVPFTLHRDRAAMRLLFVATQPVEVPDAARLVLACKDGVAPFSAMMALPAAPDFAEDVT
jgi:hypothetical protein